MTTPDYPVLAWIAAIVLACYLPRTVQRIRRRRATAVRRQLRADLMREAELQQVTRQRDRYCALYHEAVKRNAALLEHIGDEREAAAVQALADAPAYFEAVAAREAASLDHEWFDLSGEGR